MAEVFVDTSAWYPLVVGDHADHQPVRRAVEDILKAGARLVTTNLVIAETHALLLHRAGRESALRYAQYVYRPPMIVVDSSGELEQRALTEWVSPYADQKFSLADGVSFAVMKRRGIQQALALDHHFATAGFRTIPTLPQAGRRARQALSR